MNKKRTSPYFILLIFIIIVVLYHLFGYAGHFGYDDLHYAELANNLLHGTINVEDHYSYRIPVIIFTAFFYAIFGVSDLASSVPALITSMGILFLVFTMLREHGTKVLIIGLSLTTFSNWFLYYSDKLMPDIYVALSVILALAIIHRYKYKAGGSKTALHAFLLALSLLFGFISKGTIVLVIPLFFFYLISDILRKRDLKFWFYSIISGIALLALYLFVIWIFTGDFFKRFDAIADNSYLNLCSYEQQSLRILLKRIFFGFFELSIYQSLATGFIFILAIFFQKKGLRYFRIDDSFSFFLVSALILFISSSFMTISITSYAPMCLDPRHYLFLVPVAAIPASRIIADFINTKKAAIQILMSLFCFAVISYLLQEDIFWKLYLPLTALFSFYFFIRTKRHYQQVFIALFAAILFLVPLEMVRYSQKVKYRKQKEIVLEQVLENNRDYIIITDEVQKTQLAYYCAFDENERQRFLSFKDFESDTAIKGNKLMLLNLHTQYLSGMNQNDLPYYAKYISPPNILVFKSEKPDISMYEMKTFPVPDSEKSTLYSSFNDFEEEVPFWHQNDQDISEEIKYSGLKSNKVSRYSSTFSYPLDSILISKPWSILVQCNVLCYAEDRTASKIVVSLEDSEGAYVWKSLEINKYLKAYSNWWPVSFDVSIGMLDAREGSSLKIYLRKRDRPDVYIDDFAIRIFSE